MRIETPVTRGLRCITGAIWVLRAPPLLPSSARGCHEVTGGAKEGKNIRERSRNKREQESEKRCFVGYAAHGVPPYRSICHAPVRPGGRTLHQRWLKYRNAPYSSGIFGLPQFRFVIRVLKLLTLFCEKRQDLSV